MGITRVRVKCCGITCPEDAIAAAQAGADAIGILFYPPSPVAVKIDAAAAIAQAMPPLIDVVAVLVNANPSQTREIINAVKPSLLQFHGDEDAAYCEQFNFPYIKACRVCEIDDITTAIQKYSSARGILLDAKTDGLYGGGGKKFDWRIIPKQTTTPLIIAGGLNVDNIAELLHQYRPWAVDVSSGISCTDNRRRKDFDIMKRFIKRVNDVV